MRNLIEWAVNNPALSKVAKILGPFGAIAGTASTLKSMDKKSELYYKAGMGEAEANANAAADTLGEGVINMYSLQAGPVGSFFQSVFKWATKKSAYKTSTEKTLQEFYSTRSNSTTIVNNPTIIKSDGSIFKLDGPINLEDLQKIQEIYDNSLIKSDATFRGHIEENVYLKDFSRLQPAKLDELKNPAVQGISGNVSDAAVASMNIVQPQPVVLGANTASWLGKLGSVLSGVGNLMQTRVF